MEKAIFFIGLGICLIELVVIFALLKARRIYTNKGTGK